MEGLAEAFAANFTVSFEPNDTAAPHPRYPACLFKDDFYACVHKKARSARQEVDL